MRARPRTIGIPMRGLALVIFWTAATAGKNPPAKPADLSLANGKERQIPPGLGPVMGQRIIDMRARSGRFHTVEDLLAIRGISQNKIDAMRSFAAVSAPPSAPPPAPEDRPGAMK